MLDNVQAFVVGLLAAPIAAIVTFLLTRPKQRADIHSSVVTSASNAVETIADVLNQVRQELEEAREEIQALRQENHMLKDLIEELRSQVQRLHGLKGPSETPDGTA